MKKTILSLQQVYVAKPFFLTWSKKFHFDVPSLRKTKS